MTDAYSDVYSDLYGGAMTRSMFDAAWPPEAPPKVDIVNRYIGGGTPHVWTQAETDSQIARSGARYVLPNFVRVPPTPHDPKDDAAFVVAWLQAHNVPKGVTHALDYETAVDATYLRAYDAVIVAAGYRTMVYGSRSFVLQNPRPSGGYWTAHWNNVPHICSDAGVVATQYGGDTTLGQPWDINLVADDVPLWDVTGGTMSATGPASWDDADWKALDDNRLLRLAQWIAGKANSKYNSTSVGTPAPAGADVVRSIVSGVGTVGDKVDAAINAIDAGLQVNLSLADATPQQIQDLGNAIADRLAINGTVGAVSYEGTVQLALKATP